MEYLLVAVSRRSWKKWTSLMLGLATVLLLWILRASIQALLATEKVYSQVLSESMDHLNQLVREGSDQPVYAGSPLSVTVASPFIMPDLRKQLEYRTSQLAVFNGKVYLSRRVSYISAAPVKAVVVLPMDANWRQEALQDALDERLEYCKRHGYGLFARYTQDFAAEGKPAQESLRLAPIRMLRQAMLAFPTADWFWLYDSSGHIQRLDCPMLATDPSGALMVAMDSNLDTDQVSLTNFATHGNEASIIISTNENTGLISSDSIHVRNTLPGRSFLELLADPLVQNWNSFINSHDPTGTAITHLARWHPQLVKTMALVSPHWAGVRPCRDGIDYTIGCLRDSDAQALIQKW